MKKILSTILVCVLLLGTMLVLVSCGGKIDKGEYVNTDGETIEIDGKNLVFISADGEEAEYTYEIKDDEDSDRQIIYLTDSNGDVYENYFKKLDDGFEFAGDKYTKK